MILIHSFPLNKLEKVQNIFILLWNYSEVSSDNFMHWHKSFICNTSAWCILKLWSVGFEENLSRIWTNPVCSRHVSVWYGLESHFPTDYAIMERCYNTWMKGRLKSRKVCKPHSYNCLALCLDNNVLIAQQRCCWV